MIELAFPVPQGMWMSSNGRLHWGERARRSRMLRDMARLIGQSRRRRDGLGMPVFGRCAVTVTVTYPRNGRADPANASPTVKALLDGLTDAGFWPDDDSEHVTAVTYRRGTGRGEPGTHMVTLRIEEVGE